MSPTKKKSTVYIVPEPEPEPTPPPKPKDTAVKKSELTALLATAPEALMAPTQRYYGETFYPQYTKFLQALKRLASE